MKGIINITGLILIITGIISLGYQGIAQNQQEITLYTTQIINKVPQTMHFPPVVGGLTLIIGILLMVASRLRR